MFVFANLKTVNNFYNDGKYVSFDEQQNNHLLWLYEMFESTSNQKASFVLHYKYFLAGEQHLSLVKLLLIDDILLHVCSFSTLLCWHCF